MVSPSGKKLHFSGYKVVSPTVSFKYLALWKDTTTLFATITDSESAVAVSSISTQWTLGRRSRPCNQLDKASLTRLDLWRTLLCPDGYKHDAFSTGKTLRSSETACKPFKPTEPDECMQLVASDGELTNMVMWNPIGVESDAAAPTILFLPGAAIDH
jgi:hypothetical protein